MFNTDKDYSVIGTMIGFLKQLLEAIAELFAKIKGTTTTTTTTVAAAE